MGQIYNSDAINVNAAGGSGPVVPNIEAPGYIGFFAVDTGTSGFHIYPGDLTPADGLNYASVTTGAVILQVYSSVRSGGTYRCQGEAGYPGTSGHGAMIFQRIDTPELFENRLRTGTDITISNCRYSRADNTGITCDIEVNGTIYPFTATPDDIHTVYGPLIYQRAVAGEYGEVAPYVA